MKKYFILCVFIKFYGNWMFKKKCVEYAYCHDEVTLTDALRNDVDIVEVCEDDKMILTQKRNIIKLYRNRGYCL